MLYVCNLLRYLLVVCCWVGERRAYHVVCVHASSPVDCFMGKLLMVYVYGFHIPFQVGRVCGI